MPTSSTDAARAALTRLVFLDSAGRPDRWLLLEAGEVVARGEAADMPAAPRTWLIVPGEQVAIHWLDLQDGLAPAQAAAAARLMLADASAEPPERMHVAVGRAEAGRTPVALVRSARMAGWLAAAAADGCDPDAAIPGPMLLQPPEAGFASRTRGELADYRALGAAFSIEPELAGPLVAGAPVEAFGEAELESGLATAVAEPPLDLLQGPYARRRSWRVAGGRLRRLAMLAAALALLTLVVQVATILRYTFDADRVRTEAEAISEAGRSGAAGDRAFGSAASALFAAVRATPNVELSRLEYGASGALAATVTADSAASLSALQGRIEASGLRVEALRRGGAGNRSEAVLRVSGA